MPPRFEWQVRISQSARADEAYHFFHRLLYPTLQNHFLSMKSRSPKGKVVGTCVWLRDKHFGFKLNLFIHRNHKFIKQVQGTQKQYAYLSVIYRKNDNTFTMVAWEIIVESQCQKSKATYFLVNLSNSSLLSRFVRSCGSGRWILSPGDMSVA